MPQQGVAMKTLIALVLTLVFASTTEAQMYPSAEMLKGFPDPVVKAARDAELTAKFVQSMYLLDVEYMQKTELDLRHALIYENDANHFADILSQHMIASMIVMKAETVMIKASSEVIEKYLTNRRSGGDIRIFSSWTQEALKFEIQFKTDFASDQALIEEALVKCRGLK